MSWDENLNWIVPLRRAVVTGRQSYREVMESWEMALDVPQHRQKMIWWYALASSAYERGCASLSNWITSLSEAQLLPAAPEEVATIDAAPFAYWVRLWKGPVHVLREQAADRPLIQYRDQTREVINPDAEFLPGDLIEYPLFKFLAVCGKSDYENLRFNAAGSPFLGDSVIDDSGAVCGGGRSLHDNMLAMRFQLIFNLGMGAFWHHAPLYTRRAGSGLLGEADGSRVYARGMMYGATLTVKSRPAESPPRRIPCPSAPHWLYLTLHWGTRNARVVPTRSSYDNNLLPDQPLTPAWSCSPCTLALSYFLLDAERWSTNSIESNFTAGNLSSYGAEEITRAQLLGSDRPPEQSYTVNLVPASPGSGDAGGVRQAPRALGDLNVACLYAHEQALVRIYPPRRLLTMGREGSSPHVGFLSVYNPVTGVDYFDGGDDAARSGQIWKFEASGAMHTERRPQRMGAGPHNWDPLEDNTIRLFKTHQENRRGRGMHGIWYEARDPTPDELRRRLMAFNRFVVFSLTGETLIDHYGHGRTCRPIICGVPGFRVMTRDGSVDDYQQLYAERAVPFLTYNEFVDSTDYVPVQELLSEIDAAEGTTGAATTAAASGH
jgi:hypothetical protein